MTKNAITYNMDRVGRICDLILSRGIRKRYLINARLEIAKRPDVLRKMEQAGFAVILLGIESAHDETLRSMRKGFNTAKFYETLAHHFILGQTILKAEFYLVKSGEKSLGKSALEESHRYFKHAFDLMSSESSKTKEEQRNFLNLLNNWAPVFNYRGDFSGLFEILKAHEDLANSQDENDSVGMFYAWLGWAMQRREKLRDSYNYLQKSLKIWRED